MRHAFKATFEHQNDAQRLMDDLHAAGYVQAELVRSGATHSGPYIHQRHAVVLSVESESEASLVTGIIERAEPARFQVERDDSVDSMTAGALATDRIVPAWPPGTEPGALQFRHLDDGHIFGTQSATSPPAGTTFQEKMSTSTLQTGADRDVGKSRQAAQRRFDCRRRQVTIRTQSDRQAQRIALAAYDAHVAIDGFGDVKAKTVRTEIDGCKQARGF